MPTYEYECSKCEYRFEKFQGITEPPLTVCPQCGGGVRRLFGAGGAVIVRGRDSNVGLNRLARCGHDAPCCGRQTPCEKPSCER